MEEASHLPNGHIRDFQSRLRNGRRVRPDPGTLGRIRHEDNTMAAEQALCSESKAPGVDVSGTASPKAKPTRLPVLKVFADKDNRQIPDAPVTPSQKLRFPPLKSCGLERGSPRAAEQDREQYWRKVRDKLDSDSPLPLNNDKPKDHYHGTYRKIISLASSPRQEIAKHKLKQSGGPPIEKPCAPGPSTVAETNSSSPLREDKVEDSSPSGQDGHFTHKEAQRRDQASSSGWSDMSVQSVQKSRSDNTSDSSGYSGFSISPISGPSTSMLEWEDRFVVHMPSAREPNPPTMNVQQIAEFQKSIEQIHNEGETMVDPETLPSPRTTTPEDQIKSSHRHERSLGNLDGQDSRLTLSANESESGPDSLPTHRRYYSPDEVGKQKFSTIWEESSTEPQPKPSQTNADGSFLGCKEINGPDVRNPDEILFFSTPEERPKVVNVSSPRSKLPRQSKLTAVHRMMAALGEKNGVREEWEPISRNLKRAQCSKPSPKTVCREVQCQNSIMAEQSPNAQKKENLDFTGKPAMSSENRRSNLKADDVFIITPTITRTMVTMADIRGHACKRPGLREPTSRSAGEIITDARTKLRINTKAPTGASPSGLRRASQNSWEKSNVSSAVPSKATHTANIPVIRGRGEPEIIDVVKPGAMRGCIRMPGMRKSSTEIPVESTTADFPKSSVINTASGPGNMPTARITPQPPSLENVSSANTTTTTHSQIRGIIKEAKVVEVAELDGQQVSDHRRNSSSAKSPTLGRDRRDSEMQTDIKGVMNPETLSLILDTLLLLAAEVQGFYHQIKSNRGSKTVLLKLFLNGILGMLEHCLHVSRNILSYISVFNSTGSWPTADDKDRARSLAEFGQALVYLFVLGFIVMIIGRAAGYVVIIGSWVVWFARPFVLVFRTVGRVLFL